MKAKKFFIALLLGIAAARGFAQMDVAYLSDMPGCCVVYMDKDGGRLNLANAGDSYFVRYREKGKADGVFARITIEKGFYTEIKWLESLEGTEEDFNNIIRPKLTNLFLYTDMGMRDKLPAGFVSTRRDLFDNVMSSAVIDFYVPITNLVCEMDADGNVINKCIDFAMIGPDELTAFFNSDVLPDPIMRDMNKIKVGRATKTQLGNLEISLPNNWQKGEGGRDYYILPDTTKRDSIIWADKISLDEMGLKDFWSYFMFDLLMVEAIVVPDSIKIERIGNAACLIYTIKDFQYYEANTLIRCLFSNDGKNFDVLCVNGYSQFIDKNMDMYTAIIESAKVK